MPRTYKSFPRLFVEHSLSKGEALVLGRELSSGRCERAVSKAPLMFVLPPA